MQSTGQHRPIVLGPSVAALAIAALLVVTALLTLRRLVGAFESALPAPALVATAVFFAVVVWSVRIAWPQVPTIRGLPGRADYEAWFITWGPVAAMLLAMVAFSWPMARVVDWFVWLPILAVS